MTISLERQASIGNGLLVVLGSLLGWYEPTRFLGIGLGVFMGLGLIFSGVAHFCGWIHIFARMPWNRPRTIPAGCVAEIPPDSASEPASAAEHAEAKKAVKPISSEPGQSGISDSGQCPNVS